VLSCGLSTCGSSARTPAVFRSLTIENISERRSR
jgi:hypothetical protein